MKHKIAKFTNPLQVLAFALLSILLIIGLLQITRPFLSAMILATIVAYLCFPLYKLLDRKTGLGTKTKTSLITLFLALVILIPILFLISSVVKEANNISASISELINGGGIEKLVDQINELLAKLPFGNFSISLDWLINLFETLAESFVNWLSNSFSNIASSTVAFVTNLLIFIIVFVSILPNWQKIVEYTKKSSPFGKNITELYSVKVSAMTKDMVLGSLIIASVNAIILGITFWILDIPLVSVAMIACFLLSFIPMLGPSFIAIPVAIILILNGSWVSGLILLAIHFIILSNTDIFLRPIVVSEEAKMPIALMTIAILGGVAVYGFLGVVFGPLIMILFITSLEIYRQNYSEERGLGTKISRIFKKKK